MYPKIETELNGTAEDPRITEQRERRRKVKQIQFPDMSTYKPFPWSDVLFFVPEKTLIWFFDGNKVDILRSNWKDNSFRDQTEHEELSGRQKCAEIIYHTGLQLQAYVHLENLFLEQVNQLNLNSSSQRCINCALVYMHRFYVFHPLDLLPLDTIACAALFLGIKSENFSVQCKVLVKALYNARDQEIPSDIVMEKTTEEIIDAEAFMINTFNCDFDIWPLPSSHIHYLPDHYIHKACDKFSLVISPARRASILHLASRTLRMTTFCLRYPPKLIAAFCINMILHQQKFVVPQSKDGEPWFYFVDINIKLEMLEAMQQEYIANSDGTFPSPNPSVGFTPSPRYFNLLSPSSNVDNLETISNGSSSYSHHEMLSQHQSIESSVKTSNETDDDDEEESRGRRRYKFQSERNYSNLTDEIKGILARSTSVPELAATSQSNRSKKRPFSKTEAPALLSTSFQATTSRFIKSTVPLKMKPPLSIVKTESLEMKMDNASLSTEKYTEVRKIKTRISHQSAALPKTVVTEEPMKEETVAHAEVCKQDKLTNKISASASEASQREVLSDLTTKQIKQKHKKSKKKLKHKVKKAKNKDKEDLPECKLASEPSLKLVIKKSVIAGTEQYEIKK